MDYFIQNTSRLRATGSGVGLSMKNVGESSQAGLVKMFFFFKFLPKRNNFSTLQNRLQNYRFSKGCLSPATFHASVLGVLVKP